MIACLAAPLAACPARPPTTPAPAPGADVALRIRIARAEARRAAGLDELRALARAGDPHARALALRGLGRIGGADAVALVVAALGDREPTVVAAAAGALGVAASLDDAHAGDPAVTRALIAALGDVTVEPPTAAPPAGSPRRVVAAAIVEALGRAGAPSAQPVLARLLAGSPALAAPAAIALGRFGRRELALTAEARAALVAAVGHADPRVRHAAAWALSREHGVDALDAATQRAVGDALATLLAAPEPELRATAIAAIARRKLVAPLAAPAAGVDRARLRGALADPDWRVAVEAVRALADDPAALVEVIERRSPGDPGTAATDAHVAIEALRAVARPDLDPALVRRIAARADRARRSDAPAVARGWIDCLAAVAAIRAQGDRAAGFDDVARCGLPDHLRLPLVGELIAAGAGTLDARRAALQRLLAHADPRVRAAGVTAVAALYPKLAAPEQRAALANVVGALGVRDPIVAGTAVDAAATLYDAIPESDAPAREALDAAVIGRATAETDAELAAALLDLIGKRALAGGAAACRAGLAGAPVRARAAAACLAALGAPVAPPPVAAAEPPPLDVAQVIGRTPRWRLATGRGELVIALRPDVAPWAVAAIVSLTRRGFYDGLEVHRVVADFVVQGGDPTQSGWGGPGFTLPAEPAAGGDAPGFVTGGVGLADAGPDSAGSQWFVMHGAAPHLDGRYTWVGAVVEGQPIADALLVGDKIVRATIE